MRKSQFARLRPMLRANRGANSFRDATGTRDDGDSGAAGKNVHGEKKSDQISGEETESSKSAQPDGTTTKSGSGRLPGSPDEAQEVSDEAAAAAKQSPTPELTDETKTAPKSSDAVASEGVGTAGHGDAVPSPRRRSTWLEALAFGVLPIVALLIATGAAYAKWQFVSAHAAQAAGPAAVTAATESTVVLLSYHADSVEKDLAAARDRLTGTFKDSYTQLVHDVVIPGAKKGHISATATVPATALMSTTPTAATVLVFVNQSIVAANEAPTQTSSTVKVTVSKIDNRWLISSFEPV